VLFTDARKRRQLVRQGRAVGKRVFIVEGHG
jgi:hypothetical protein